jgi:NFU1 iron-sulfur cluster scaffold homolog, mitochondrial
MAEVLDVSTTPNPDAMKFTVDRRFDEMFNVASVEDAASNSFAAAVFEAGGVASVFGTADFVTITRADGGDWTAIEAAVRKAAAEHL